MHHSTSYRYASFYIVPICIVRYYIPKEEKEEEEEEDGSATQKGAKRGGKRGRHGRSGRWVVGGTAPRGPDARDRAALFVASDARVPELVAAGNKACVCSGVYCSLTR
jgi:hypothetical protein